ncbi:hypothetical protein KUL70_004273 [Vibrio parahaemolyticus]|nr:hypothetical protein [Vibrio parahaemolyticus]
MSTYCKVAILIDEGTDVQVLLTNFAFECYNASRAVKIDYRQYGIDGGMNNVRAIIRNNSEIIEFCCRYQGDVQLTEDKVKRFAHVHDLQLVNI